MKEKAWVTFLSSSDQYYFYMLISLYMDLLKSNTKYPFYCAITEEVDDNHRKILEKLGINVILINNNLNNVDILKSSENLGMTKYYIKAFSKLCILGSDFEKKFDKIVYLDSDLQIFSNIDELFDKEHMSAVMDEAPLKDKSKLPYKEGDSVFCSGLFVWDFKNNANVGQDIIDHLELLDKNIRWHDQNVLNFYYRDWGQKDNLHLDPTYALMNSDEMFNCYNYPTNKPKVIHFTGRERNNWPFRQKTSFYQNYPLFIDYLKNINYNIDQINKIYGLNIELLHLENIDLEHTRDKQLARILRYAFFD